MPKPLSHAQKVAEQLRIIDGLIGEARMWADAERVAHTLAEHHAAIERHRAAIVEVNRKHADAARKLAALEANRTKLLDDHIKQVHQPDVERLQRLLAEAALLQARIDAAQGEQAAWCA